MAEQRSGQGYLYISSLHKKLCCSVSRTDFHFQDFQICREPEERGVQVVLEEVETQKDTMAKGAFSVVNMMLFACFAFALMSVYVMVTHEVSPATSGVRVLSAMLVA